MTPSPPSPSPPASRSAALAIKKKRSDRTVNVGYDGSTRVASFKKHLNAFVALHGRVHPPRKSRTGFFSLSDILRHRIWRLVLDDLKLGDHKPIRLSSRSLYIDVYPDDHFKTLDMVFRAARPYLSVSFGVYADVMATILFTEYFHIVLSPFIGGGYFNPLVREWLPKYGHLMRHVILELDLSRLGFSAQTDGMSAASGTKGMDVLIDTFVQTQLKRKDIINIQKFFLLCRRYYGNRPISTNLLKSKPSTDVPAPFCPDSALRIAGPLIQLNGLINSIRVCGFNADYAKFVIAQLFDLHDSPDIPITETKGLVISKVSPWPRMKGQTSYIDIGKGKNQIVLDNHDLPMPLAEDEKIPVSYFDADFDEPEGLTFKQRSVSFTTKLVKSLRERKEKTKVVKEDKDEKKPPKTSEFKEATRTKTSEGKSSNAGPAADTLNAADTTDPRADPRADATTEASAATADATTEDSAKSAQQPAKETKKQRNARVRRSMSLGSVPVSATPWDKIEKTTSRISLRKQVSNFTLRSKASKKTLNSSQVDISQGQDSETLIPDVPPIPQHYRDAGYAKPNFTESSTKYGPTVKGTKTETQALLNRPKTPAASASASAPPKKPIETPSRLRFFRKTPKKISQEEPVVQETKTPSKHAVSSIPRPTPKRPAGINVNVDQTPSAYPKPLCSPTAPSGSTKSSKPDAVTYHAIDHTPVAQRERNDYFRATPTASESAVDDMMKPRLRKQQSNIQSTPRRNHQLPSRFDMTTFVYRDQSAKSRTQPQRAIALAPGELAMPRPRPQEPYTLDPDEMAMPRPRSQRAAILENDLDLGLLRPSIQQMASAYGELPPHTRPNDVLQPRSGGTLARQAPLTLTYADRSMNPFSREYNPASANTRAPGTSSRPVYDAQPVARQQPEHPLRTMRSSTGIHPNMDSFHLPNHASAFQGRRPPPTVHSAIRPRIPGHPTSPLAQSRQQISEPDMEDEEETMIDGIDPNRSQYEIIRTPEAIRPSMIPGSGSGRRYMFPVQAVSESSMPTTQRPYQQRITPSRDPNDPFRVTSNRRVSEKGMPIEEDEDSQFF